MAELVVLTGVRAGAVFELPEMPTVVGRSPEAHFQLDDPWISSMHAMFERRGAEIWVVDLESRNGTFVGVDRIQEAHVDLGAILRFGRTEVRIERDASRQREPFPPRAPTSPVSRPTSRLNAPSITAPGLQALRPAQATAGAPDRLRELPLARRQVVLLRLALHLPAGAAAPDAALVRGAIETLQRAAIAEGGLAVASGLGVLALFGVAGPSPDDADFAVRAARAALADVANLDGELSARAAVDAGAALVGSLGGADGLALAALGEPAERVERVLALAGPGEILVGPGAAAAAGTPPPVAVKLGELELPVARVESRS